MVVTLTVQRPMDGDVKPITVQVEHGKWSGDDDKFIEVLGNLRLPYGYHPDPDFELAQLAAHYYAGEVKDNRKKPPPPPPGTVE